MNKEQLAEAIGVSGALIGLIEKGERQGPENIKAFANKVKVRMDDIVISDREFATMRAEDATPVAPPEPEPAARKRA